MCLRENIHSETYSLLLRSLIRDEQDRATLFSAIETMPAVKAKVDWCLRWIESPDVAFPIRLIAFAIVEGIFFSSSFAAIFWMRSRGLMPALSQSNELIARDEGMHTTFACILYRYIEVKPDRDVVTGMVAEAVALEHVFFECKSFYLYCMWSLLTLYLIACSCPSAWLGGDECRVDARLRGIRRRFPLARPRLWIILREAESGEQILILPMTARIDDAVDSLISWRPR